MRDVQNPWSNSNRQEWQWKRCKDCLIRGYESWHGWNKIYYISMLKFWLRHDGTIMLDGLIYQKNLIDFSSMYALKLITSWAILWSSDHKVPSHAIEFCCPRSEKLILKASHFATRRIPYLQPIGYQKYTTPLCNFFTIHWNGECWNSVSKLCYCLST